MDYSSIIHQQMGKEKIIRSGAAGAVVKDGKILLVRRHNLSQTWGIPGGVQELEELIRETAHREVLEEVRLDLQAGDLISVYSGPEWEIALPDGRCIQQLTLFFRMDGSFDEVVFRKAK